MRAPRPSISKINPTYSNRIVFLDAARGLAALLVVFHHLNVPGAQHALGDLGRTGVLLFFFISGYCIFLAVARYREQTLKLFLMRRAFRLYPAYWISVIAAYLLTETGEPNSVFLINMTMIQAAFGVPNVIGVYWTLFVEILFYGFVCMLIVLRANSNRRMVLAALYVFLCLSLSAALVRHFAGWAMPFAHFLFMATFLLGGVFYFNRDSGRAASNSVFHASLFLICVGAISALVYVNPLVIPVEGKGPDRALYHFGNYFCALTIFAAVYLFLNFPNRACVYLGAVSYSLYLFHPVIVAVIFRYFVNTDTPLSAFMILITIGLTLLAATSVYLIVEKPLIRVGRRLETSLRGFNIGNS